MIPSPKVATYDKQPEMSVQTVAEKVAEVVKSNDYEFVMCNFAPPDMVRTCLDLWGGSHSQSPGRSYRGVRRCGRGYRSDGQGGQDRV